MTVRSSVAQDVLNILLGNITGRFWIGLHLPIGCPDITSSLRGFQWVTEDTDTDFSHWPPGFDSSCSAHRCVSVSMEDDFLWVQEPCEEEPTTGFLCEHSFTMPCKSLMPVPGEWVFYRTPVGFGGKDLLSLPPGTTATRMQSKSAFMCFSGNWLPAPWSCEIMEGGCEYQCAVDPTNTPSCYCPQGQAVDPANNITCSLQTTDDPCVALGCAHICYMDADSYKCTCDHGFQLAADGRSCVDFNDCRDERQCPGENFACINTVGGFKCVCAPGFQKSGDLCVDVNECMNAPCEHQCDNTPGSYRCSCYDGYQQDPAEPHRCRLHCGAEECPAECDPNFHQQCYCPEGYVVDERDVGVFCVDMDECSFFYCDQDCENTFGSYVCSCSRGFTLMDGFRCVKMDDEDTDPWMEGSGTIAPYTSIPTPRPHPGPTGKPTAVTVGGLVGIIVCAVFLVVLVVFLVHHLFNRRVKMEGGKLETHGLQQVTSDS